MGDLSTIHCTTGHTRIYISIIHCTTEPNGRYLCFLLFYKTKWDISLLSTVLQNLIGDLSTNNCTTESNERDLYYPFSSFSSVVEWKAERYPFRFVEQWIAERSSIRFCSRVDNREISYKSCSTIDSREIFH